MSKEDRITLWAEVEQLEIKLQEAVDMEDYSQAAALRDRVKHLKLRDPYTSAKEKMDIAIAAEKYEEAGRWRNIMAEVGEPPQKPGKGASSVANSAEGTAATSSDGVSSSDITTLGIRVQVVEQYNILPAQTHSDPPCAIPCRRPPLSPLPFPPLRRPAQAASFYVPEQSSPADGRFLFGAAPPPPPHTPPRPARSLNRTHVPARAPRASVVWTAP